MFASLRMLCRKIIPLRVAPPPRKLIRRRSVRLELEILEKRELLATYMVTTNADHVAGSLRQAILNANAHPGLDTIDFHLPSKSSSNPHPNVITPTTLLPAIKGAVIIDGTTDPGYVSAGTGFPYVVLNGDTVSASSSLLHTQKVGLTIDASGCTVRGLAVVGWGQYGILINSASNNDVIQDNSLGFTGAATTAVAHTSNGTGIAVLGADNSVGGLNGLTRNIIANNTADGIYLGGSNNDVFGNYIGVTDGKTADGNGAYVDIGGIGHGAGIAISGAGNTIGGMTAGGQSNVISGNKADGIVITGSGAKNNNVINNLIGTDSQTLTAVGNPGDGVIINDGANHNQLDDNLISNNSNFGVEITGANTANNVLQGNHIGTNASGTAAMAYQFIGVEIDSMSNTIGGTAAGQGNLISGNMGVGIGLGGPGNLIQGNLIGVNQAGTAAIPNGGGIGIGSNDNTIGGAVAGAGNIISGNGYNGLDFDTGSAGNTVLGNFIGVAAGGMAALPNLYGISIESSANNTIGGISAADRNVISGNSVDGVDIVGAGSTGNTVQNNYVGINIAGNGALPNGTDGITFYNGATGNSIILNIVSGNGSNGVELGGSGTPTMSNTITQNRIGTTADGSTALGNGNAGVAIDNAANANNVNNNLISGNSYGVVLTGAGTSANLVQGNLIGTDATGALPLGNANEGIVLSSAANGNFIGGTAVGDGNVISGNGSTGILINAANGNRVQSNDIGVEADGMTALANAEGITIISGASNNLLGGANGGNVISDNSGAGISITGNTTLGDTISANVIYGNGGLGISLGGSIYTDTSGPLQTGPNHLLNYPILSDGPSPGIIAGTFAGVPNASYTIEFFGNPTSDFTAPDQGRDYLGSEKVTASPLGIAYISFTFKPTQADPYVTATATDAAGDTSEFSPSLDLGLTGTGLNLSATEGVGFNGVVATFKSVDPMAQASSYTVTIFWGDDQSSTGTVVAGPNGTYAVLGSHTYSASATVLFVTVQIDDILGAGEIDTHGTMSVRAGG